MNSVCPRCLSKAIKKNGYTRHGKQNHRCLDCGKQFSLDLPEFHQSQQGECMTAHLYSSPFQAVPEFLVNDQ